MLLIHRVIRRELALAPRLVRRAAGDPARFLTSAPPAPGGSKIKELRFQATRAHDHGGFPVAVSRRRRNPASHDPEGFGTAGGTRSFTIMERWPLAHSRAVHPMTSWR